MNNTNRRLLLGAMGLSALTAGLTSVLVVSILGVGTVATDTDSSLSLPEPQNADLRAELVALRAENERLSSRVGALELRPSFTQREAVEPSVALADLSALQLQLEELRNAVLGSAMQPSGLKAKVADALSAVRDDEANARLRRALEKQASRLESRVTKMTDRLGLNVHQATDMRVLLAEQDERDNELTRLWNAGGDETVLGEMKRSNRATHNEALERVLDADQMQILVEATTSKK
jgi:hypothetical protein